MGLSFKQMFQEIFFFIILYPPESKSEPGARAAKIEEPRAGAAKKGRLRNTGLWDVLYCGTFCTVGCFVLWDILSVGCFVCGTFCLWDVLSEGCFVVGPFVVGQHRNLDLNLAGNSNFTCLQNIKDQVYSMCKKNPTRL